MSRSMLADRFRGFLPVVIDIETGGFDPQTNPILEIAAVQVRYVDGVLTPTDAWSRAVHPFAGSRSNPAALRFTGIDPTNPDRGAVAEAVALGELFQDVRRALRETGCHRAVLVAHNAAFDHQFLTEATDRQQLRRNPFHPFTTIDTASLAAVAFGHTVLREACARAAIAFDDSLAHSASYDAARTAELFCTIVNRWPHPA